VQPSPHPIVATLIVAYPPEPLATLLAESRYYLRTECRLKPILVRKGQTICRVSIVMTVDKRDMGGTRERDYSGRPLPAGRAARDRRGRGLPDEPR
jgi:type IV secretory pathway protease TraF